MQLNRPLTTDKEAVAYLRALLPELVPRWRTLGASALIVRRPHTACYLRARMAREPEALSDSQTASKPALTRNTAG